MVRCSYNSVKMWMQEKEGVTFLGAGKHMVAAAEAGMSRQ